MVVLHNEARAAEKLAAFTNARDPWIVAVNMVSEGVDIPRLRVGVYATAAKTPLVFRQIVGRFVRTIPRRPSEPSWLYIPADPILRDHAAAVQQELRHALRPAEDEYAGEFDRAERLATERGETPMFEPLSADVTPQMTLFGTPARAAPQQRRQRGTPDLAPDSDPEARSHRTPAFEQRARLRNERHRLVSELTRRDGSTHREINAWINRKLGIASVEHATPRRPRTVGRAARRQAHAPPLSSAAAWPRSEPPFRIARIASGLGVPWRYGSVSDPAPGDAEGPQTVASGFDVCRSRGVGGWLRGVFPARRRVFGAPPSPRSGGPRRASVRAVGRQHRQRWFRRLRVARQRARLGLG